jgi:hypothetical protein
MFLDNRGGLCVRRPVLLPGGRLRVHWLRLGPVSYPAAGRDERFPSATLR